MRCPKCGYISFDHMDTCLKCNKDISKGVEVTGTTYHAVAPSFLRVPEKNDVEVDPQLQEVEEGDFEFIDPDLDVLNNEDEADIAIAEVVEEDGGIEFQLEADEEFEGEGFDFDIDDDEDEDGFAVSPVSEQESQASLSVPDELADISDLAPPVRERVSPADSGSGMELSLDDEMSLDDSLDLDGLDLDLGLGSDKGEADAAVQSLSLDDIDLSEADLGAKSDELGGLNMDLDLDGLDENSDAEKEKSASSLDGLSLSLD